MRKQNETSEQLERSEEESATLLKKYQTSVNDRKRMNKDLAKMTQDCEKERIAVSKG